MRISKKRVFLFFAWAGLPLLLTTALGNIYAQSKIKSIKENSPRSHDKYTLGIKYAPNIESTEINKLGDFVYEVLCAAKCPFWDGSRAIF